MTANNLATEPTQNLVESANATKFSDTILRWLSQLVGIGADYPTEFGASFAKEVLTRGLVIVCAGAALYALREGSIALWHYLQEQLTLTVVVRRLH